MPKGRPRFANGRTFTPARTREWEDLVAWNARIFYRGEPLVGPVSVTLRFHGARANADLDNLTKAVLDACNGICFVDDRQVALLEATRGVGDPGVMVTVEPLP